MILAKELLGNTPTIDSRHGCELVVFCRLAFRAGGQPEKRLLLAHHRSLDCLHVPAKQLPSRAPVLPSRSHRNGNKSETQGVRRWAARGQGTSSQFACARRQVQVEYFLLAGCASRHRAKLGLRPVRCAYPHAVRLLRPLPPVDGFVGIDRIDSTKRQYCLLNCLPCCATCNFMKGYIEHHVGRHIRIKLL